MAVARFPTDPSTSVGRFWVAGTDRSDGSDGVCRVEGKVIEIEVARPLTNWMETVSRGVIAMTTRPAQEVDNLVIQGSLPVQPARVTFVGAKTAGRRRVDAPGAGDTEAHRLRAEWCIAGAHIDSADHRFNGFRIRLNHLELWALTEGVVLEHQYEPSTKVTITYETATALETPFLAFGETEATMKLLTSANWNGLSAWGGGITTHNILEVSGITGWTLEEALSRFVTPVQTLLTLLAGSESHVTGLEVLIDGSWRPVFGHFVSPDEPRPKSHDMLLTRADLSLDLMVRWCEQTERLSPTPQVVAAVLSGSLPTVDSEALALTTTSEGMDRALYPDSRRFTQSEVDESIAGLEVSAVPQKVRNEMIVALRKYFAEDTYPMRMHRLALRVAEAVPACVGKANRWKNAIRDLRVQLAHSLEREGPMTSKDLLDMAALVRSLRWTLQLRLLQEVGVPDAALANAVANWRSFGHDERFWRSQCPSIFRQPAETP